MNSSSFLLWIFMLLVVSPSQAAKVSTKAERKVQSMLQIFSTVKLYHQTTGETHTLSGFEKFSGHKLTKQEKRIFNAYQTTDPPTPEEEAAMQSNKRLAMWSLIFGIAGVAFLFVPVLVFLSFLLIPGALITGIMGASRAKKLPNPKKSGYGNAMGGIILGSVGLVLLGLAIAFLLANGLW